MVTYNYSISYSGYTTIQQAIDSITLELAASPTITSDIVIDVGPGTYAAIAIPRGALSALYGTSYRLIIRSSGKYFPVIDAAISPSETYVGIDIDSANPNVTIEGLRIQNFSVGVRATNNSHSPIISKCIFNDNTNVNILIEQCSNTVISQCILTNGDYGIVTRLCKGIALLHNSVFLSGAIGEANAGVWAQLANDYGGGVTDTGKLYLLGNIIWNMAGLAMLLFQEDLETSKVVSNFNDIVRTTENLIGVEKKAYVPSKPRERRLIKSLSEWRDLRINSNPDGSILDAQSISQDPKFLQAVKSKTKTNGLYLDLTVLSISPVLGIVPSFYIDTAAALLWLPSYADSELLAKDILRNDRMRVGTAAGANDRRSNAGYFGQDVFVTPRDLLASKSCDSDPIIDLIHKKLDLWAPSLRKGYFFSNERQYYLYAKKACRYIGECAVTFFDLPGILVSTKPIKILVSGIDVTDPRYIDVRGNQFVLYHYDLDIQDGTEELEIQGYIRAWEGSGFIYSAVVYRFKISEGLTKFYLPPDYVSDGPVVITDDRSTATDTDELANREFKLVWDVKEQRTEIVFANYSNQFINAQFDKFIGTEAPKPYSWQSYNTRAYSGDFVRYPSPMGDNYCQIGPAGHVAQMVPIDQDNYSVSWHSRVIGASPDNSPYTDRSVFSGQYSIALYDHYYDSLGVTLTGEYLLHNASGWIRNYLTIGSGMHTDVVQEVAYPMSYLGNLTNIPEESRYALIKFTNLDSSANLLLTATQYEKTDRPTIFHRKFRFTELTVEYETSKELNFIDTRQIISPVRNTFSQGFIHIPELPAGLYNGPGQSIVTTLNEIRWPAGRMFVMPWARLTGKDKLRNKVVFNTVPEKHTQIIQPSHSEHLPYDIKILPSEIVARQGDKQGVGLQVICTATDGNPYALGKYLISVNEPMARFPGWLVKKFYGLNEQLTQQVVGSLENAGNTALFWIPPDDLTVSHLGVVPSKKSTNSRQITSIELNYRADPTVHGNAIILDQNSNQINTKAATPTRTTYRPTYSQNFSSIALNYPPVPGTVKVQVDGVYLTETFLASPNSDQFFADPQSAKIVLKGRISEAIVEYVPSYVFVNNANPYRLQFYHDELFGSYTGSITIGYDALIDLSVAVYYPDTTNHISKNITVVAQNHLVSNYRYYNQLALEY